MFRKFCMPCCAALAVVVGTFCTAQPAAAELIAYWRFEDGSFLTDSSGNGHTLSTTTATNDTVNFAPVGGNTGSAAFNNAAIMKTVAALDLSGYLALTITWWQQAPSAEVDILFEHSSNKNVTNGGFASTTNEAGAGLGLPDIVFLTGNHNELLTHFTDTTWRQFSMVLDLTQTAQGVMETRNITDNIDGIENAFPSPTPGTTFLNDFFFLGARDGGIAPFTGNLDEFRIEGTLIPEPSSFAILAMGLFGFARLARKRRRA